MTTIPTRRIGWQQCSIGARRCQPAPGPFSPCPSRPPATLTPVPPVTLCKADDRLTSTGPQLTCHLCLSQPPGVMRPGSCIALGACPIGNVGCFWPSHPFPMPAAGCRPAGCLAQRRPSSLPPIGRGQLDVLWPLTAGAPGPMGVRRRPRVEIGCSLLPGGNLWACCANFRGRGSIRRSLAGTGSCRGRGRIPPVPATGRGSRSR